LLFVWERVRAIVPATRAMFKNPESWKNLETLGNAAIERMKSKSPEAYPAFQTMVRSMVAPKEKAGTSAA